MNSKILKALVIIFAVIGLIAVIALVAMWIMHGAMMGEMCSGMGNGASGMSSR
jgi:uncharacterized membrane protein